MGQNNTFLMVCEYVHTFVHAWVKGLGSSIIAPGLCVCIKKHAAIDWKDTAIIIIFFCIDLLSSN